MDEALRNVAVLPNVMKLLPEYEGRLIHLSGPLKISEPLTEPDYGVIVSSVKLKRRVQMYQWVEIEEERRYIVKHFFFFLTFHYKQTCIIHYFCKLALEE